jgi:hypothetical protein
VSKNIYQRINDVMKEVSYVQKDATVTGGGSYKAVTHDMVTAVVRPAFVKHGIVVRVEQLRSEMLVTRNPKEEQKMHLYSGDYAVHFVNVDNPEDVATETVNAHANDSGDKAPGKAMSYAVKYAILKLLSLETGENDESRFAEPYTKEQAEIFHELLEQGKAYEYYLFMATLPPETQTGLVNSFPDGKKTQGKKTAAKLESEGHAEFLSVVEEIQSRIANHDPSVLELTDEMSPVEKQFLAKRLSDFEVRTLKKLKEAAA